MLLSNRSWKSILCIVSNYPCSLKKRKCLWQYWNVFLVFICSVVSWNLRCSAIPRKCNNVAMFPSWSVKKKNYSWFRLYACVDTETMLYQATPFCLPSLVLKCMFSWFNLAFPCFPTDSDKTWKAKWWWRESDKKPDFLLIFIFGVFCAEFQVEAYCTSLLSLLMLEEDHHFMLS